MNTIKGSNVTIMVKDMDKSISFYESIGLTVQNRWGDHYAMLVTEGITLGIHPGGTDQSGSGTVSIGFFIDNINETKKLLDKNKIQFRQENDDKSGIYVHFTDPDGTILYFVQPMW